MAVPLHAAADDLALDDVEGGEQGGPYHAACSHGSSCRRALS